MRRSHPPEPPRSSQGRRPDEDRSGTRPTRARAQRLIVGTLTLLVGVGLGWLAADATSEDRFREMQNIAEALMEEEGGAAWPPRQHEGALDGGVPPGPRDMFRSRTDAGPPLPSVPPARPGFQVRQERRSGLYLLEAVIGDAEFDDPLPMVVVLHGRGDRAHVPGGPFLGLTHPVRVVVPQAPEQLGEGWQWLPVRVGDGLVDRLSSTLFETADDLARFIREILDARQSRGRAIVTGFSQGGLLTLTLAVHHDDVVGHAIPLASWLPPPLEPSYLRRDRELAPIRSMHGTADPIIPIDPTNALFGRLEEIGFEVELVQVTGVEHTMSEDMNELFHEWLEEAVCRTVGDAECAAVARERGLALRDGTVVVDGGVDDAPDAGAPDGGPGDAGPARRRDGGRRVVDLGAAEPGLDPGPASRIGPLAVPPGARSRPLPESLQVSDSP